MSQASLDFGDGPVRRAEFQVPEHGDRVACQSCGRLIVWIRTRAGERMPLSLATAERRGDGRYWALSHFADCPDADRWRKFSARRSGSRARGSPGSP